MGLQIDSDYLLLLINIIFLIHLNLKKGILIAI
jgi:hypothetical protein